MRVVVHVIVGEAVCLNIAQLSIYCTVFRLHKFTLGYGILNSTNFLLLDFGSINYLWGRIQHS